MKTQSLTWFSVKECQPPTKKDVELLFNIVLYDGDTRKDRVIHAISLGDGTYYQPDHGFWIKLGTEHGCISHWTLFPVSPVLDPVSYIFHSMNSIKPDQSDKE